MPSEKSIANLRKGGGRHGPNKVNVNAREAIARLVDGNTHRLEGWLDEIAEDQGALAAWKCMMDVIEYHIPKLARTELTGPDGGRLNVTIQKFSD